MNSERGKRIFHSAHGDQRPLNMSCVVALAVAMTVLAGCSSVRIAAPVESRNIAKSGPAPQRSASSLNLPTPDGFYRVRKGDTIISISLDHGVAWRDLASWNQIDNPNLIEIDQLLRIKPPASAARTAPPVAKTDVKPIAPATSNTAATPAQQPAQQASAPTASSATPAAADGISLSWPSSGRVIQPFADPGYKGIAISGNEGDPVLAAGDGRVVYSGSGLRGYGNLVIVKHDGDFLTAYAHNKSILVTEGQAVKRGQRIAELGKSDSDVPKLHFEVRRSGKPVDPMKYLAQR